MKKNYQKIVTTLFFFPFFLSIFFVFPKTIFAETEYERCMAGSGGAACLSKPGSPAASAINSSGFGNFNINPLGDRTDIRKIVGDVIRAILGIIGTIALIIFFYGGIQWMTSLGEEARIKKGRETMVWAGLGLVVVFASYTIVQFIISRLLGS